MFASGAGSEPPAIFETIHGPMDESSTVEGAVSLTTTGEAPVIGPTPYSVVFDAQYGVASSVDTNVASSVWYASFAKKMGMDFVPS